MSPFKIAVHLIRFRTVFFVHALKHCRAQIFIRLDIRVPLHGKPCGVKFRFCQQKFFARFCPQIINTLLKRTARTKSDIQTMTHTLKRHINIEADNYFRRAMYERNKTEKKTRKTGQKRILCTSICSWHQQAFATTAYSC